MQTKAAYLCKIEFNNTSNFSTSLQRINLLYYTATNELLQKPDKPHFYPVSLVFNNLNICLFVRNPRYFDLH